MNSEEVWKRHLADGGRVILYEYCVSLLFLTLRRPVLVRVKAGDNRVFHALPCILLSLLLGWWGAPWGLIFTPLVLITDLRGGRDITDEFAGVLARL